MKMQKLENMDFFIYYRVSTDLQNTEMQERVVNKLVKDKKINVVGVFEDISYSGALGFERPAFKEMYERLDEADGIIVYDWDRISREEEFAVSFMHVLKRKDKIVIEASTGNILDFSDMGSRILTYVKSVTASEERIKIKQRQKDSIQIFIKKHGRWGRFRNYGETEQGTKLTKESFWIKYELYRKANISKMAISRLLKISPPTLYKNLHEDEAMYQKIEMERNKIYKGDK